MLLSIGEFMGTISDSCRFAVMLREKEDTELKPVTTEGDTTYIYVKVAFGKEEVLDRVAICICWP